MKFWLGYILRERRSEYTDSVVATGVGGAPDQSPGLPFFSKVTDLHSPIPAVSRAETVTTAATREIAATNLPW
jgi:hypothetical protein